MSLHSDIDTGSNHIVHQWEYADAAARTGATGFATSDIGKLCKQLDTGAYYVLHGTTPTWYPISPSAISGDVTITGAGVATVTDLTMTSEQKGSLLKFNSVNWVVFNATSGQQLIASNTSASDFELISKGSANKILTMTSANSIGWRSAVNGIGWCYPGAINSGSMVAFAVIPFDFKIANVKSAIGTTPTTTSVIVDIYYSSTGSLTGASTIFLTSANCCIITAGDYTATSGTPDTVDMKAGGVLVWVIRQIGTGTPGSNLCTTIVPDRT